MPESLTHAQFVARPLTVENAALDYAAYMASPQVIRAHSHGRWPVEGFSFADDLELVARHQQEHENGTAFTFTLQAPAEDAAVGCLYINSLEDYLQRVNAQPAVVRAVPTPSAMVTFWIRQDLQTSRLPEVVVDATRGWLQQEWPFAWHVYRVARREVRSRRVLEGAGLGSVAFDTGDAQNYLWFGPPASDTVRDA